MPGAAARGGDAELGTPPGVLGGGPGYWREDVCQDRPGWDGDGERFHELLEREGIIGAPHLARAFWVALERWDALRAREIEEELGRAHALIYEKLPKRTKAVLALPEKERAKLIRERKKLPAARAKKTGNRK